MKSPESLWKRTLSPFFHSLIGGGFEEHSLFRETLLAGTIVLLVSILLAAWLFQRRLHQVASPPVRGFWRWLGKDSWFSSVKERVSHSPKRGRGLQPSRRRRQDDITSLSEDTDTDDVTESEESPSRPATPRRARAQARASRSRQPAKPNKGDDTTTTPPRATKKGSATSTVTHRNNSTTPLTTPRLITRAQKMSAAEASPPPPPPTATAQRGRPKSPAKSRLRPRTPSALRRRVAASSRKKGRNSSAGFVDDWQHEHALLPKPMATPSPCRVGQGSHRDQRRSRETPLSRRFQRRRFQQGAALTVPRVPSHSANLCWRRHSPPSTPRTKHRTAAGSSEFCYTDQRRLMADSEVTTTTTTRAPSVSTGRLTSQTTAATPVEPWRSGRCCSSNGMTSATGHAAAPLQTSTAAAEKAVGRRAHAPGSRQHHRALDSCPRTAGVVAADPEQLGAFLVQFLMMQGKQRFWGKPCTLAAQRKTRVDGTTKASLQFLQTSTTRCMDFALFNSATVPTHTSFQHFIERISQDMCCSPECFILACVYLERLLQKNKGLTLTVLNIQRFYSAALLVAVKYHDDLTFHNVYYASVLPSMPSVNMLNSLERAFLIALDYELHVTADVFTAAQAIYTAMATATLQSGWSFASGRLFSTAAVYCDTDSQQRQARCCEETLGRSLSSVHGGTALSASAAAQPPPSWWPRQANFEESCPHAGSPQPPLPAAALPMLTRRYHHGIANPTVASSTACQPPVPWGVFAANTTTTTTTTTTTAPPPMGVGWTGFPHHYYGSRLISSERIFPTVVPAAVPHRIPCAVEQNNANTRSDVFLTGCCLTTPAVCPNVVLLHLVLGPLPRERLPATFSSVVLPPASIICLC